MGMRISNKWLVTIPAEVRRKMGLEPGDQVSFSIDPDTRTVSMVKVEGGDSPRRTS